VLVFTLIFYLIYRQCLRSTIVFTLFDRETRLATLRTFNDIDENMTTLGTFARSRAQALRSSLDARLVQRHWCFTAPVQSGVKVVRSYR